MAGDKCTDGQLNTRIRTYVPHPIHGMHVIIHYDVEQTQQFLALTHTSKHTRTVTSRTAASTLAGELMLGDASMLCTHTTIVSTCACVTRDP